MSARRCGTGGTMPEKAVGYIQEAEEQMLFETCEKGVLRALCDVLRDCVMGGSHTRHQVPVHVSSNQVSGSYRQRV